MENLETPVRILVVDDEPDIRNILHILLSSRGYEVERPKTVCAPWSAYARSRTMISLYWTS